MKTLYRSSHFIAATIIGAFVLSAGAAVAVTTEHARSVSPQQVVAQVEDLGRFVVMPKSATYVRPAEDLGRFVVSQNGTVFHPAA